MLEMPFLIGLVPATSSVPTTYAGPAPFLIAGASQINFSSNDLPGAQGPTESRCAETRFTKMAERRTHAKWMMIDGPVHYVG